jgi:hypothetical protein
MMICHHYLKLKETKVIYFIQLYFFVFALLTHSLLQKKEWFAIPYWVRQTPDFISMSDELFNQLEEAQIWLEFKIFRSLLVIIIVFYNVITIYYK